MAAKYGFTEAQLNTAISKAQFGLATLSGQMQDLKKQGKQSKELSDRIFNLEVCLYCLTNFNYEFYSETDDNYNSLTVDECEFIMEKVTVYSGYSANYFSAFSQL